MAGETTAKVWRADREDGGLDAVGIGRLTRANAGASVGERAALRGADPEPADELEITMAHFEQALAAVEASPREGERRFDRTDPIDTVGSVDPDVE